MAGFDLAAQAAPVAVEGRGRFDQDRPADGITGHVRGGRLDHAQALGGVGGDHVQRRGAAGVFRRADGDAIHADAVEVGIQATDDHEAPLALVTGDTDAGQALQRFGHVLVRVDAHGIGRYRVLDGVAAALEIHRAGLRLQLRTHLDAVQVDRPGAGRGRHCGLGGERGRAGQHQQRQADRPTQRILLLHGFPQRCKDWVSTVCPRGCMGVTPGPDPRVGGAWGPGPDGRGGFGFGMACVTLAASLLTCLSP
ncbi:hypothetical protein D3C71_1359520 [compost metagenome]